MPESPEMRQFLEGEWTAKRLTKPVDAMMTFFKNPESFLRKHPIINTFDCAAHGQTTAYFRNDRADALRPGSKLGKLHRHTTESFNLESVSGANCYGYSFPVHGIFTSPSDAPSSWYTLDATGPALMLTAKLTGCTFAATKGPGGNTLVTHLQPNHETGIELNTRMQGPDRAAYGRLKYDFDIRSINIIGVRLANQWQIWAQKLIKNSNAPTIMSVNRIWPL